jgi:hypothetical protein
LWKPLNKIYDHITKEIYYDQFIIEYFFYKYTTRHSISIRLYDHILKK